MGRSTTPSLPLLAKYFVDLREARNWKQATAASHAKRRKIWDVTYQALRGIEEGKTKNPEPALLRGLAALYGVEYSDVAALYVAERFGLTVTASDLPRHPRDQASDANSSLGGVDELSPSARHFAELERRVAHYETALAATENAALKLVNALAAAKKGGTTRDGKSGRGGRHRRLG